MPIGVTSNMGWLSAGNGGSTVKTPVFLTSGSISYDGNASGLVIWNLTSEQKSKIAGFTHPLFTVQVCVNFSGAASKVYTYYLGIRSTSAPSGWWSALPSTPAIANGVPSGVASSSMCVSGQYDYDLDNVVLQISPYDGGTIQSGITCIFTVKTEEVEV